jgi:hypothetical protein
MLVDVGYRQLTDLNTAVGLGTIPAGARFARIIPEGAPVRWRDDGTNATSGVGEPMAIGDELMYTGVLSAINFIQQSSGGILNIVFGKS